MPARGPQDEGGDNEGEDGVDPVAAGEKDACAPGDNGRGGKSVAGHVDEGGAEIHVAGHTPEESGDNAVHQHAGSGYVHHEAGLDGDGDVEAVDGFEADPEGDEDEGSGVDEGGQNAGALVAESAFVIGRAGLEVDRRKAEQEGKEVGGIVACLGEQGQGVGAQAGDECDGHVSGGGDEGEAEYGLRPVSAGAGRGGGRGVDMHMSSVIGAGYTCRGGPERGVKSL